MIELRWTWKQQDIGLITGNMKVFKRPTLHPVLQYRYTEPIGDGDTIFTKWQDVPIQPMPIDE